MIAAIAMSIRRVRLRRDLSAFLAIVSLPYRMKITPEGWLLPWILGWQFRHERFWFHTCLGWPGTVW
jgi:hypothetical protein